MSEAHYKLMFLPGLVVANIVSFIISGPDDRLFWQAPLPPDQPIFIGFPLSFYELGAWGHNEFYSVLLAINIMIVGVLGSWVAARRLKAESYE